MHHKFYFKPKVLIFRIDTSEEENLARSKKSKKYAATDFEIESMDPLGQGVSKQDEKTTFIAKVLPGEKGKAQVYKESRGVRFALLAHPKNLELQSSKRTDSPCPHFNECQGCHFLHTDYNNEIEIKKGMVRQSFRHIPDIPEIETYPAQDRFGYRNRIQLHYDKLKSKAGFISKISGGILEVPKCLLPAPKVRERLSELYLNQEWKKLVKTSQVKKGHIEIIEDHTTGEITTILDKQYSHGGFTQVNASINQKLKSFLVENFAETSSKVLELFSGKGNLSIALEPNQCWMYDFLDSSFEIPDQFHYEKMDLYDRESIAAVLANTSLNTIDTLLLDPPRKGFPHLNQVVEALTPSKVVYISCNLPTLIRDISQLVTHEKYQLKRLALFDMFPGTRHYETLISLERL